MKYGKIVGLLVLGAMALMAFSASASASILTTPAGAEVKTLKAVNSGNLTLHGFVDITCTGSTVEGEIEKQSLSGPAEGPITSLTFTGCNHHVKVIKNGRLELSKTEVRGSGSEVTVEVTTIFGSTHCLFGTGGGIKLGTATQAPNHSSHAEMKIEANINTLSTDFACGFSPAAWTGKYTVNNPVGMTIDH